MANTPWIGQEANKLYLTSGEFSTTLKTSQLISATDTSLRGISWDGTDTPWGGILNDKIYLTSGQFTSTIKTSLGIVTIDNDLRDVSATVADTPWGGNEAVKLYLNSGQFTSTIKDSEAIGAIDTSITGASADMTDMPWAGTTDDKLYLQSGQITSTLKTSEAIGSIETGIRGGAYNGTDSIWTGNTDDKLYLTSGQFTSTLKTSQDISSVDNNPLGVTAGDFDARMGLNLNTTGDGAFSLPTLEVQGLGGASGGIDLSIFTLNGLGHLPLDGAFSLPLPTLSASVSGEVDGSVDLPVLTLSASGVNATMITSDITLPMLTVSIRAYNGSAPECVVMNTKNFAVSEYLNFGFNSYARFNSANLICDQNGIYEMDTTNVDDSVYKIKAAIRTARIDTYKERIQRLRNGWLNYQTDGDIKLVSVANKTKTRTYNMPYLNIQDLDAMIERRIKFERGIKDRYFDFKIENINGSDIEVDKLTIMLEPIVNKRR